MARLIAVLLSFLLACPALAQDAVEIPDTPAGRSLSWALEFLSRDFAEADISRFHPDFLAAVPPAQLRIAHGQIRALFPQAPALLRVERSQEHSVSALARSSVVPTPVRLLLDVDPDDHRIVGFLVQLAPDADENRPKTWDDLGARLADLPGTTFAGVYRVRHDTTADSPDAVLDPIFEHNADHRLAVGSTFKLYVLHALAELIRTTDVEWDDALAIRDELKSLPSGEMQNHASGSEFPLRHYALKMISISDNTATDHLLAYVGRERVEASMRRFNAEPARNTPFLSTSEMFRIKLSGDPTLPARYADAPLEQRRAMLEGEIARATAHPMLAAVWLKPIAIDRVEWFASARECARIIAELDRLAIDDPAIHAILSANPGMPFDDERWPLVLFKGGSEPGVLNLTWLIKSPAGDAYAVTLGWNNPDENVDLNALLANASAAVELLGE